MFVRLAVIIIICNYKIISSYKFIWRIGKKKKGMREREKEEKNKEKTKHDLKYPKEKGNPKKLD